MDVDPEPDWIQIHHLCEFGCQAILFCFEKKKTNKLLSTGTRYPIG
jgi:hypothetical protein